MSIILSGFLKAKGNFGCVLAGAFATVWRDFSFFLCLHVLLDFSGAESNLSL